MTSIRRNDIREEILIVDDTPTNLRLLSQMLGDHGYGVRAVTSGERAIASARAIPPSLILLDIKMPEMSGYEVAEELKSDNLTVDIPIIFISALDDIQDKVDAFTVGGVDYITKPFQLEEVLARVETHLALTRMQKQLQDANEKFEEELNLAGKLQATFFPSEPPSIPGWQMAVKLKPARQTSGDFYDILPLPDDQIGIVIADVVDKGVAAALYMALSWTLLRTYAAEFPTKPEKVFSAANQRIIQDTDATRFVTAFFGILNPSTGTMVYSNAGHNPPFHFSGRKHKTIRELEKTGLPMGLIEDHSWEQRVVEIAPGDVLVLYTDGVPDAQNPKGKFFGVNRMLKSIKSNLDQSARAVQKGIMEDVIDFVGVAPQLDDMATIVVVRDQAT
jgi:sigma-B regulation protein RsbU (phosphoserine phosphatase)